MTKPTKMCAGGTSITPTDVSHLITEDFDLAVGPMDGLVTSVVVAVCINLDVERQPFYPFLGGEVCTQTVHRYEHLHTRTDTH